MDKYKTFTVGACFGVAMALAVPAFSELTDEQLKLASITPGAKISAQDMVDRFKAIQEELDKDKKLTRLLTNQTGWIALAQGRLTSASLGQGGGNPFVQFTSGRRVFEAVGVESPECLPGWAPVKYDKGLYAEAGLPAVNVDQYLKVVIKRTSSGVDTATVTFTDEDNTEGGAALFICVNETTKPDFPKPL